MPSGVREDVWARLERVHAELKVARTELEAEIADENRQLGIADERPLTLAGLREQLVDLEERWLPTVGVEPQRPQLTLIQGGRGGEGDRDV